MRRVIGLCIIAGAVILGACTMPENNDITLAFSATDGAAKTIVQTGIEFSSFKLSIRDVEFKQDENDPDSVAEVYFTGPYMLDLLDTTGPVEQTIGSVEVPAGTYQEIRFKLHKTIDAATDPDLFDRSIYLNGTIDSVPFEMWHDTSENLDVGRATGIIVGDGPLDITINFDLQSFLDQTEAGGVFIDLTTAKDGDNDGIIEINPSSDDGTINRNLADDLKDNIKLVADLL